MASIRPLAWEPPYAAGEAPIQPLAWELPYAAGVALKRESKDIFM